MSITFFSLNTLETKYSSSFQVCPFLWSFAEVKQLKISFFYVFFFFLSLGPLIHRQINQAFGFRPPEVCDGVTFATFPLHFHLGVLKKSVILLLIFPPVVS